MEWLNPRLSRRDWSGLPDEILSVIMRRIDAVEDLIVLSGVCRSWRPVALEDYLIPRTQPPWLLLAEGRVAETRGFFSIFRNKRFNVMLENIRGRRCWGSRYGFLLVLEFHRQLYLFNPLTRRRLDLPPKPIFKGEMDHDDRHNGAGSVPGFVRKGFVFRNGEGEFLIVVAGNLPGNLAIARPGQPNWIPVNWIPVNIGSRPESAALCNGNLFFVDSSGSLYYFDGTTPNEFNRIEATHVLAAPREVKLWDNISLVEFFGHLLLVLRYFDQGPTQWYKTKYFRVYKLDLELNEWIRLDDLGDKALFIDADNSAMAVSASQDANCRSNCVYFVEKYWGRCSRFFGGYGVGVYSMVDGTIEPKSFSDASNPCGIHQNPIWLMPGLY